MKAKLTPEQLEKARARKRAWRKRHADRKSAYDRVMRNWIKTSGPAKGIF